MKSSVEMMREALKHCIEELQPYCDGGARIDDVLEEAKSALALPLRNCDVGTEEEQTDRYWDFCSDNHVKGCFTDGNPMSCPIAAKSDCRLAWAQLPYTPEKKGTKNE